MRSPIIHVITKGGNFVYKLFNVRKGGNAEINLRAGFNNVSQMIKSWIYNNIATSEDHNASLSPQLCYIIFFSKFQNITRMYPLL